MYSNKLKEIPSVSVIIPNYNHAQFLPQRIDSVINQTFQDFEIIILDDCSTDNSKEIIERYRQNLKIKHIVYNKINSGNTFKQWEKGIALAKGEFIWVAESDDVASLNLMQELMTVLTKDREIVLAYCQSYRIDDNNNVLGNWLNWSSDLRGGELFNAKFEMDGKKFIREYISYKNIIPNASAVIFRKSVFINVGGVDTNIKYCSDWLTWMKMLTFGKIFYTNLIYNNFRQHIKSVIAVAVQKEKFIKKYDIIMRKAFDNFLKSGNNDDIKNHNKKLMISELRVEKDFAKSEKKIGWFLKYKFQLLFTK